MKRILIVDDQPVLRAMVRDILEEWSTPLQVSEAESGPEALVYLQSEPFDLVICDIKMPVMDGFEVVQKIRAGSLNPGLPIILLTAESDPDSIARGASLGATSYLTKPFNETELVEAVEAFVGSRLPTLQK